MATIGLIDGKFLDQDSVLNVTQTTVYYVGKHGSDLNDGKTPDRAFLTWGAVNAVVVSGDCVKCFDNGTYTENLTFVAGVNYDAPNATLVGHHQAALNGSVNFFNITASGGVAIEYSGAGQTFVKANIITNVSGTDFMYASNAASVIYADFGTATINSGAIIGQATAGTVYMKLQHASFVEVGGVLIHMATGGRSYVNLGYAEETVSLNGRIFNSLVGAGACSSIVIANRIVLDRLSYISAACVATLLCADASGALANSGAGTVDIQPYGAGLANGICPLDATGKVDTSYLPTTILGAMQYQGVWDCSGGAYPTSPETGDYYIASVAGTISGIYYDVGDFLAYNGSTWDKFEGKDETILRYYSAGSTFDDSTGKTITNFNVITSAAVKVFGAASGLFNGTDSYLSLADSADWHIAGENFTVDMWVRFDQVGTLQMLFDQQDAIAGYHQLYFDPTNGFTYKLVNGGADDVNINQGAVTCVPDTYYHVAIVRNGNDFTVYLDGVAIANTTSAIVANDRSQALSLGNSLAVNLPLDGYMDEFRFSKGIARWTTNFAVPIAEYTLDSYVKLLVHFNAYKSSYADLINNGVLKTNLLVDNPYTIDGRDISADGAILDTIAGQAHDQNTDTGTNALTWTATQDIIAGRDITATRDLTALEDLIAMGDSWLHGDVYIGQGYGSGGSLGYAGVIAHDGSACWQGCHNFIAGGIRIMEDAIATPTSMGAKGELTYGTDTNDFLYVALDDANWRKMQVSRSGGIGEIFETVNGNDTIGVNDFGKFFYNLGASILTLPVYNTTGFKAGDKISIYVGSATYFRISLSGTETARYLTTTTAAGGYFRSNSRGSKLTFINTGTSEWIIIDLDGSWTYDA